MKMKFQAIFLKSHKKIEVEASNQQSAVSIIGRNTVLEQGFCPRFRLLK